MLRLILILTAILFSLQAKAHSPAVDDAFTTPEDTELITESVLTNDVGAVTLESIDTTGTQGTVSCQSDGICTYNPNGMFDSLNAGQTATDTFRYTMTDGGAPDEATVTITITGVTQPPPGGGLSPYIPNPGEISLIPDSGMPAFDYTQAVAMGLLPSTGLTTDLINCYTGWAFDGRDIYVMAGGGHSCWAGSDIAKFSTETVEWTRIMEPRPASEATDPQFTDNQTQCHGWDDRPPALHTYDGILAIPGTDKILVLGTSPKCFDENGVYVRDTFSNVAWEFNKATTTYQRLPHLDYILAYASTAYDPVSGMVYVVHSSNHVVHVLDPADWSIVNVYTTWPYSSFSGTAVVDPINRKLYMNSFYRMMSMDIAADGSLSNLQVPIDWSEDGFGYSQWYAQMGTAVHPDGRVVFWSGTGGEGRVYTYTPSTDTFELVINVPIQSDGGMAGFYGKMDYLPEYDTFITVADARMVEGGGLLLFRLPDAPLIPPTIPETPEIQEGEIFKWDMDSEALWRVEEGQDLGPYCNTAEQAFTEFCRGQVHMAMWASNDIKRPEGHPCTKQYPDIPGPQLITELDGNRALMFTYAPCTDSGSAGNFMVEVTKGLERALGVGDRIELQFRYKLSKSMVYDENGKRRGFLTTQGGQATPKIFIFSTSNNPAAQFHARACTWDEIVLLYGWDQILEGYNDCGWYAGFQDGYDNNNPSAPGLNQQPGGEFICDYYGEPWVGRGWNNQMDTCFKFEPDRWYEIRTIIDLGEYNWDRTGPPSNRIQVFADGKKVIDYSFHRRGPVYDEGKIGHGNWWLTGFVTGKSTDEHHPEGYEYYDDLRACLVACP